MSNVCPIHKKESKNLKGNYRAISLLPILSKIFEKIIFDCLYLYFTKYNLLVTCRSGFIKGDSCINQLLEITHTIHKNPGTNPSIDTRCVFLDMSKAFDKVWHDGLIFKLKSYGINPNILFFLKNYLLNLICNPKLFADNVSLSAFMHDNIISTANLRDDLKRIHDWSVKCKMVFNPDANKPINEIIFTNRNYTL